VRIFAVTAFFAGVFFGPAEARDTIPDLSGVWARNSFNFESPLSGPGPIRNLRRLGKDANQLISGPGGGGDPIPLVGDYTDPILKPHAAEIVKRFGEWSASGHDTPDPSNQCADFSPPFMLQMQQAMQIIQMANEIVFIYRGDDQVRHVRLNESHPAKVTPSPMGHSVAHYDGDALVIDTIGIKLEPFTVVDRFGTPQSDAMHVIERYRLIDADDARAAQERHEQMAGRTGGEEGNWPFDPGARKGLQIQVTVDDPNIFTTQWSGNLTYRRTLLPWDERVCAENNTDVLHQGFEHVPTAEKPDF
jgi:hypothetical protein